MDEAQATREKPAIARATPRSRRLGIGVRDILIAVVSVAAGATGAWLLLRDRGEVVGAPAHPAEHQSAPTASPAAPPKPRVIAPVRITPDRQQLIGVRTALVEPRELSLRIRTVGVISYDETRMAEIHTKVAGWVEKVNVDYTGKRVKRGDPLLTIYSPDLVSAQNEYLLSLGVPGSLAESARRRLRLWDISEKQIAELERTREPSRTLTLYSPADGVVVERSTFRGQYVTPAMSAVKIADLSTVWVLAEVFETEIAAVQVGHDAQVELHGAQPTTVAGKVDFVFPSVDPRTRRIKVRIALENPGDAFKPASYVTVLFGSSLGRKLTIPKEAVIDDGDRQYALLALPDGYFQPRDIHIGAAGEEHYAVLGGLKEGDRVVTSAQFLVDSETNLAAAMQAMSMSMPGMDMGEGADTKGMDGMPGMDMPPDGGPAKPAMDPETPMPGHQHTP